MKKFITSKDTEYLISLFLSITAALIIGALIMMANGRSPIIGYASLIRGAFGSKYNIATTLAKTVPLILTGLATAISFRSGIYNIGGEGQLYLGAFAAAYVGFTFTTLPGVIGILLAIIAGAIVGALYAFIPALLKVYYKIDEVITTIMLNSVAVLFTDYLVNYPFAANQGKMGGTDMVETSYRLSRLIRLSTLNTSIFMMGFIALIIYYIMQKTSTGYSFKMVGQNATFAKYGGINAKKQMIVAMLISGGLCGVAGVLEVLGTHYRFLQNISPGFAFDGMLVALIVKNNPIGVVFMSIFFGALKTGSIAMENTTSIPSELVLVIQAIIILFIAGEAGFKRIIKDYLMKRNLQQKVGGK
ncbi:nucleoside ABC transporter membrane protein [Anaerovirgula multivorans]|uniref:Nucleoside ABC transporter membrane protein n=1 Tax=Anaerovirgula multivorans TaxID=312168 RepID=A0A239I9A4_9FIRM|nr:ABC transporter permease [Anaerovirgula multivorans]SNS89898.1 nucleoside ABC transporter membrane protein [Anaerovirgula multivorans]